jgi:hypothetical protein
MKLERYKDNNNFFEKTQRFLKTLEEIKRFVFLSLS